MRSLQLSIYDERMLKPLFIALGVVSLGLGAVGIFLPVLPTTPFLLLSAWAFSRSSTRLHAYLINHRVFGTYISNYYHHAMTPAHKARTLGALWFGIIVSVLLLRMLATTIVLPIIATLVSIHIIRLEPRPKKALEVESES